MVLSFNQKFFRQVIEIKQWWANSALNDYVETAITESNLWIMPNLENLSLAHGQKYWTLSEN